MYITLHIYLKKQHNVDSEKTYNEEHVWHGVSVCLCVCVSLLEHMLYMYVFILYLSNMTNTCVNSLSCKIGQNKQVHQFQR